MIQFVGPPHDLIVSLRSPIYIATSSNTRKYLVHVKNYDVGFVSSQPTQADAVWLEIARFNHSIVSRAVNVK